MLQIGQHLGLLRLGVPHRFQRVGGLAGLRDRHHQRAAIQHRVAVAELAGQLDLDGQPGPVLDRVLGQQPGVVGGAAGHHEHLVDLAQLLVGQALLVEHDAAVDEVAQQRVGHRGGLLGDLLEHEVLVAALLGGRQVPVDMKGAGTRVIRVAVKVGDAVAVGGDRRPTWSWPSSTASRVYSMNAATSELTNISPSPTPNTSGVERRAATIVPGSSALSEHQREVALEPAQHGQHRCDEVAGGVTVSVLAGDQLHGDLAVGVAGELHPDRLELAAQRGEVLDDAVVDDRDLHGGVAVRVCVAIGRSAMSGPAGMPQACVPAQHRRGGGVQRGFQVDQSAGPAAHRQSAVAVEQGDPGGVVAPVFHSAQRANQHIASGTVSDVANDSTHSATRYRSATAKSANTQRFAQESSNGGTARG